MYKCADCGHLFEEGEELIITENIGDFRDMPAYKTFYYCPICKGDFNEIKPCTVCGSYEHDVDKLLCHDCEEQVKDEFANFACNLNEDQKQYLVKLFENGEIL